MRHQRYPRHGKYQRYARHNAETTPPPAFQTNLPKTKTATVGEDVTFKVLVKDGKTPYGYKWFYGATLIDPGVNDTAKTDTLVNHAVTTESAGDYSCEVTDSVGRKIVSNKCVLTVNAA